MRKLMCVVVVAAWCAPAVAGQSIIIQDFETDFNVGKWPASAKFEFSTDWAKSGRRSLKVWNGSMVAISHMTTKNWKAYQTWRIHVYVPGKEGINIGLELTDHNGTYHDRHQNSTSAPPGESAVDIDIGGEMWLVNEKGRLRFALWEMLEHLKEHGSLN